MNDSKPSARRGVRWSVVEGAQDQRAYPDEQEALVDADLDTLATALYVRTDDLLKASPEGTLASEGRDCPEDQRR